MELIKIDFSQHNGPIKNMDAVNNGPTAPSVRTPTRTNFELYKNAGFSYARNHDASFYGLYGGEHTVDVHRIFKNFDADETDPANYIFEPTDGYLLNTVAAGTKIFYRLGASIEHQFKYGTRVPKDFAKWARICEHIIRHYNEGWADGFQLGIEYWEIWNEPDCRNADGSNPCWQGTEEQFVELYCVAAKHLKEQFPHLKIGGPAFCSPMMDDFKQKFFDGVRASGAPLDFFSYHCYARDLNWFREILVDARAYLDEYGFTETEAILNEWNYVKGWLNENWDYTLAAEQGLKGASFITGAMAQSQSAPLDMLMYYDARPCTMNGIFSENHKPRKGYYCYTMFRQLKELGTYVPHQTESQDIFTCSATDGKNHGILLTYFNDDAQGLIDLAFALQKTVNLNMTYGECYRELLQKTGIANELSYKDVCLDLSHINGPAKVSFYCLDDEKDGVLVREELISGDAAKLYLKMTAFSTYLVKIEALA